MSSKHVFDRLAPDRLYACFYCSKLFHGRDDKFVMCDTCEGFTACLKCWDTEGNKKGWDRQKLRDKKQALIEMDNLKDTSLWPLLHLHLFSPNHADMDSSDPDFSVWTRNLLKQSAKLEAEAKQAQRAKREAKSDAAGVAVPGDHRKSADEDESDQSDGSDSSDSDDEEEARGKLAASPSLAAPAAAASASAASQPLAARLITAPSTIKRNAEASNSVPQKKSRVSFEDENHPPSLAQTTAAAPNSSFVPKQPAVTMTAHSDTSDSEVDR